jgi:signal transduction histidine kinase
MQDTGIGIPPEKLASVFDRFVQVDLSLTRRAGGMGLGLSIARDLARGMDGELAVASTEGEGSVFTLTLPRAADLG